MNLVDVNVLLYAHDTSSRQHLRCRDWLRRALNGSEPVGLPWMVLRAFLRIATNARAVRQPLAPDEAWAVVDRWLSCPRVIVPEPGGRYRDLLRNLMVRSRVRGPLVSDAALAALALEHGAVLCTTDRDFRRFDGLALLDPTADEVHDRAHR